MPLDLLFRFMLPWLFRNPATSNFFPFPLGLRNSGVRLYMYVVTKGSGVSLFFVFVLAPISSVLSQGWLLTMTFLYLVQGIRVLRVRKALFKCFWFWGVFSNQSYFFAFNETSLYPRRVEWGKVYIWKGFSQLIVRFDVQWRWISLWDVVLWKLLYQEKLFCYFIFRTWT